MIGAKMPKYDVAVVTINYNSSKYTIRCVESILNRTSYATKVQIIVVDNNSSTQEYQNILKLESYPNIRVVKSRINLGFAAGNMYGLQYVDADYYFFLNNDCILLNDAITHLLNFCRESSFVGLCSPQLYDSNGRAVSCIDYFPDLTSKFFGTAIFRITRKKTYFDRKKIPQSPLRVEVLSGSQLFVPANVFNKVGGFDTTFFLYCEEEDLAYRIHKSGYQIYVVPRAMNHHEGGGSTLRSVEMTKEFVISFLYFYRKHYGGIRTRLLALFLMLRYFKKSIRKPSNFRVLLLLIRGAHLKYSLRHKQTIS